MPPCSKSSEIFFARKNRNFRGTFSLVQTVAEVFMVVVVVVLFAHGFLFFLVKGEISPSFLEISPSDPFFLPVFPKPMPLSIFTKGIP